MIRIIIASLVVLLMNCACAQQLDTRAIPTPVVIERPVVVTVEKPVVVERERQSDLLVLMIVLVPLFALAIVVAGGYIIYLISQRNESTPPVSTTNNIFIVAPDTPPYIIRQIIAEQLRITPLDARRLIETGVVQVKRLEQ